VSRRRIAAVALAVLLVAGCGISSSDRATPAPDDAVPYGLLDPDAAAVVPQPSGRDVQLCLLQGDQLVPVERAVEPPTALIDIARALAEVTASEAMAELHTSIAASDEIQSVQRSAGVATVELAEEASQRLTADPLGTVAQLVCTLTRQPGVGLVRFTVAGVAAEVPRADGSLSNGPVSADDYAGLMRQDADAAGGGSPPT
jgi:spore germination protein GerM